MITLKNLNTGGVISLSDGLLWVDEHSWSPVAQSQTRLLTGSLLVETATKKQGRPISLADAQSDMGWVKRATLNDLQTWASERNTDGTAARFELTMTDGRKFTVIFRNDDTAIEAAPVKGFAHLNDDDYYHIYALNFTEVGDGNP